MTTSQYYRCFYYLITEGGWLVHTVHPDRVELSSQKDIYTICVGTWKKSEPILTLKRNMQYTVIGGELSAYDLNMLEVYKFRKSCE